MSENPVAINPKSSSYYSNTRPEMLKYIPSNVKIALEVGCAGGSLRRNSKIIEKHRDLGN